MIDQFELHERFDYNQITGIVTWRFRKASPLLSRGDCQSWNTRFAGRRAGAFDKSTRYRVIGIGGGTIYEHRIILCMMNGYWPEYADHENGVRDDNRLVNLNDTTKAANNRNRALDYRNVSGYLGVHLVKRGIKRWRAEISVNNKTTCIGSFHTKEEAAEARRRVETELGFHTNHGRKS